MMKHFGWALLVGTAVCMAGCKEKLVDASFTRTYEIVLNAGEDVSVSSETAALNDLVTWTRAEVAKAQETVCGAAGIYELEVTGVGSSEEEAKADADAQALAQYTSWKSAAEKAIADIETGFAAQRAEKAAEIAAMDDQHYVRLTLVYLLQRVPAGDDESYETLSSTEEVVLEAVGGTQYE